MHKQRLLWLLMVGAMWPPTLCAAGLTRDTRIDLDTDAPDFQQFLTRGWHTPDSGACWTGRDRQDATIRIFIEPGYGYDVLVLPAVVPRDKFDEPYSVQLLINGQAFRTLTAQEASSLIEITVPTAALDAQTVEVAVRSPLFCPLERGESTDGRWLGIKVQRVEILPYKREASPMAQRERAIGILCDPDVPKMGYPSDPHFLAELLREANVSVRLLSADELSQVSVLDRERLDLIVLPYGPAFPAGARRAFQRFLRRGGGFISMGGYALDHLYGAGFDEDLLGNARFDDGLAGWRGVEGVPGLEMAFDPQVGRTEAGSAKLSATAQTPVTWYGLTTQLPGVEAGTTIALDGYVRTRDLKDGFGAYAAISYYDSEGRRITWGDSNRAGGTSQWVRISTLVKAPQGAERAMVSLLLHGRGTAWFDDLQVRTVAPSLNTRGGRPADFLEVEPDQISVFDAGYPLEHAVSARPAPGQDLLQEDCALDTPLTGMAAVGMTGEQWYCTSPEKCRYVPLLQTRDAFGRPRGPAAALMLNYRGLYKGSAWAFFGVDNVDLFSADHPGMCRAFVRLVQSLRDPIVLHETQSDVACYRPGEPVRLTTHVSNFGRRDRQVTAQLTVREYETSRVVFAQQEKVALAPGQSETVTAQWQPEAFGQDIYQVEAVLVEGGAEVDREDTNGFVIWDEEVLKRADRLQLRDNFFQIDNRPLFMVGAQQFWASLSLLNCSPLTIAADFRDMRDYGVRLARSFMMWQLREDHQERRFRDMMVYLAHKYGVVMYHEGTGGFPPKSDDLSTELQRARFLAERYGDLPLFCVDHRNEPSLRLADSPRQNAWLQRLTEAKYGGEPPYGAPKVANLSPEWGDLRSYDTAVMGADELARWSAELSGQMRVIHPDLPISVGFLQENNHPSAIKDPLWASEGLDFMNRHFYGPLRRFPPQFKEIDMRYRGMPPSSGEFGSRTHPTGGGNFESKEEQFNRYLFISHYALGLGGAFVSNWHWRDPWESIFSYGIFRQDHTPKDVAKVYRQIGLLLASIRPVYRPPAVYVLLPDYHRLSYHPLSESLYRCLDEMMNQRVDFGVINERNLGRLPDSCRALVFPLPYLPAEETVEALTAFVSGGGTLYVSGDLSYDAQDLQRSHPRRLLSLCGVDSEEPDRLGLKDPGERTAQIRPTGALPGAQPYAGRNRLRLHLEGAQSVALDQDGQPVTVLNKLGEGKVLFTADPVEVDAETLAQSGLYPAFLQLAGIEGHKLAPDDPELHCFAVGTQRGQAYVLYNRHQARAHEPFHMGLPKPFTPDDTVQVSLPEAKLTMALAPMKPGFAHISRQGALLAVECQGKVEHRGAMVMDTDTHATVIALDDKDVRESEHLAVIGLYPGEVRLGSSVTGLQAEVGELRDGQWQALGGVPLEQGDGTVGLAVDEAVALEIILVSSDLPQARRRLQALAGF